MINLSFLFKYKKNIQSYSGFTLAEILLTLVIIGVVSSLTIPVLINDVQDNLYKTAYKKAFADGSAAFTQANNLNEIVHMPVNYDDFIAKTNWDAFKSKFIIIKTCENNDNGSCWDQTGEKVYFDGQPGIDEYAFIDNQGRAWSIYSNNEALILCDTNGFRGPNLYGRDRWVFIFADANNMHFGGPFVKFISYQMRDYPAIDSNWCPSGGCYYMSWLKNSK